MCGISGFSADKDLNFLNEMSRITNHRGPDDSGIWFSPENGVGLCHNRLSIIDLSSSGKQPMWDSEKKVVISFNGEIYNYRELKKSLIQKGYSFKNSTDTEVILNLYLDRGTDILKDLNGIFAFAIWDTQKKLLFVARDGMGVKPLYYTQTSKGFYFASELKTLVSIPEIEKSINFEAIHYYLTYLWCPSPLTPLNNVFKLEPGHALIVENKKIIKKWQFYEIPVGANIKGCSLNESIDKCRYFLSQSVSRQMVADVEVATFLSGGLDSSAITHYARLNSSKQPLRSFTIKYCAEDMQAEGFANDLPYAIFAAEKLGVSLNVVDANFNLFEMLPFMVYHLDEPQADPAPLNVYLICKLAREAGVKVLLSGAGGDDLFTGYRRHQAIYVKELLRFISPSLVKRLSKIINNAPENNALTRRLKKAFNSMAFTGAEYLESNFHWLRGDIQNSLYSGYFKNSLASSGNEALILQTAKNLPSDATLIDKMLFLELKYFLADHNLNYTDKMSMATGVEVRVPFLDPDLVAFAFSLPSKFKQHGTTSKWILKKAMEPYLPHRVIYRPKTGFGIPLRKVIRDNNSYIMSEYFSKSKIENRGLFDHDKISNLISANQNGSVEAGYSIFSMICIEEWMRLFIDGKSISTNVN